MSAPSGGVEPDTVDEIDVRIVLQVSAAMCKLTLGCLGQEHRWFITQCLLRDVGLDMTYSTPAIAITLVEDVSIFTKVGLQREMVE